MKRFRQGQIVKNHHGECLIIGFKRNEKGEELIVMTPVTSADNGFKVLLGRDGYTRFISKPIMLHLHHVSHVGDEVGSVIMEPAFISEFIGDIVSGDCPDSNVMYHWDEDELVKITAESYACDIEPESLLGGNVTSAIEKLSQVITTDILSWLPKIRTDYWYVDGQVPMIADLSRAIREVVTERLTTEFKCYYYDIRRNPFVGLSPTMLGVKLVMISNSKTPSDADNDWWIGMLRNTRKESMFGNILDEWTITMISSALKTALVLTDNGRQHLRHVLLMRFCKNEKRGKIIKKAEEWITSAEIKRVSKLKSERLAASTALPDHSHGDSNSTTDKSEVTVNPNQDSKYGEPLAKLAILMEQAVLDDITVDGLNNSYRSIIAYKEIREWLTAKLTRYICSQSVNPAIKSNLADALDFIASLVGPKDDSIMTYVVSIWKVETSIVDDMDLIDLQMRLINTTLFEQGTIDSAISTLRRIFIDGIIG